jgi:Skp family chaperone for outer membrane proteins
MKFRLIRAATIALAASLVVSYAHASDATPPPKKHHPRKAATPPPPSVQEQIDALRQQMQTQIDSLKNDLSDKDAQLKQAQQSAADAQAAAAKAQAAADAEQQALGENATAVTTLQNTVTDMKAANASVVSSLTDETSAIKKSIANPDALYYKGITISPAGSFLAAETVWRSAATGGDINTPPSGIPLQNSEAGQISEFFMSGRQSRVAIRATGKLSSLTATGYYEADWLSAGTTSNNNQSNSYTLRQRQLWGDVKSNSGWDFSGGQGWSLAAETTQGLTRGTEILPSTIDAQYEAGFVWARQASLRLSKNFGKAIFAGVSVENAETLNPGGNNLPANVLIGSGGTSGGLYNPGGTAGTAAAIANYTFNYAPDLIVKLAVEPGWGHWELFGIERTFRDRIYPNLSCSTSGTPSTTTCTPINTALAGTAGAYNNTNVGAGIGGGFRGPLLGKKVTIGLKGLYGQGVGRYGDSTIADVTIRPNGQLSPIHGFSALSTVEVNPTPKLNMYFNYGGDELDRDWVLNSSGTQVGYGNYSANMTTCNVEPNPGNGGVNQFSDPTGAGSGCAGSIKDDQEFTAGYWFTFFNNAHGRLRQGIQYSYWRRDLWSGAGGTTTSATLPVANPNGGAYGTDNMLFTSFRYYLP